LITASLNLCDKQDSEIFPGTMESELISIHQWKNSPTNRTEKLNSPQGQRLLSSRWAFTHSQCGRAYHPQLSALQSGHGETHSHTEIY